MLALIRRLARQEHATIQIAEDRGWVRVALLVHGGFVSRTIRVMPERRPKRRLSVSALRA